MSSFGFIGISESVRSLPSGAPASIAKVHEFRAPVRQLVQPAEDRLLSQWGVEDAVDFHDVIVKQAPDFDHRARWIWRFTPEFCLRFLHHRCEPVQVAYVNGKPYAILEARSDGDAESVIFSAG